MLPDAHCLVGEDLTIRQSTPRAHLGNGCSEDWAKENHLETEQELWEAVQMSGMQYPRERYQLRVPKMN